MLESLSNKYQLTTCTLIKKETALWVFIVKNTFFTEHLRTAALGKQVLDSLKLMVAN